MTTVFLAPDPIQGTKFVPGGNTPANGAQLFCYAAGSTTKQSVYTTNLGTVAWANPIVLDSGGNLGGSNEVWIVTGVPMKFVLAPSNDTDPPASPYWSMDNVSGINDTSGTSGSTSEWVAGPTPTFVSSTQFTLAGDQTATFTVGRRVKATVTAGTVYGTITASAFAVSTTVTIQGAVLDSGLSAIFYGLLDPANTSIDFYHIARQATAVLVASATTNIWASDGNSVHLSSTVTIGSFSSSPYVGARKTVIADAAFTLQNSSTTLIVPGGQNKTVSIGDTFDVYADTASKMRILNYSATSGPLTVSTALATTVALNNTGTYFDGPSIAQGTAGNWFVTGSIVCADAAGIATFRVKLWDGTTVISAGIGTSAGAGNGVTIALSSYITNPAGNLRISAKDSTSTNGTIQFNLEGSSKDSTIFAQRIG